MWEKGKKVNALYYKYKNNNAFAVMKGIQFTREKYIEKLWTSQMRKKCVPE